MKLTNCSVQNAAARVMACLSKFDYISDPLKELHWLPVEQRIIFRINLIYDNWMQETTQRIIKLLGLLLLDL